MHRTTIRNDIISIFEEQNILESLINITVIDTNGQEEKGKGKRVTLDILTHFWQEFFTVLTSGSNERIPHIRHDLQKPQWEAIARVIVYGYRVVNYFPLKLSQAIVATCLFGEESLTRPFLLTSFNSYVAADDREILDMCLSGDCNPVSEDVLEFLSVWKCFKIPTEENLKTIMFELAHQELVQKPRYIVHCWTLILRMLQVDPFFQTKEGLANLYESKRPTAKKVIKLLTADISHEAQRQTFDHLKRYVRSLEGKALQRFLHFITGSDVLSCQTINVEFNTLDGFQRRPVVHTCGPMLELPTTYETYTDLAEEFTNIMREEQAWSFDIV